MRRLLITIALGVGCVCSFAQGTLNFANAAVGGLNAQVKEMDGVTPLAGSGWEADLFWAPGVVTDSTLLFALNAPASFSTVPAQAGYFFGGPRTIPGAGGGSLITGQVRVWNSADGSTWDQANLNAILGVTKVGESAVFTVTLTDPNASPPATMSSLQPFAVHLAFVPEPSTLALGCLGSAGMLMVRRRTYEKRDWLNHPPQRTR